MSVLKVFIPETSSQINGKYCLFIPDGCGRHPTPKFDNTYSENDIIQPYVPCHSSNHVQPLDAGSFSSLKRVYGSLVDEKMQRGFYYIDTFNFIGYLF